MKAVVFYSVVGLALVALVAVGIWTDIAWHSWKTSLVEKWGW